jgi:hypothetical protein
MGEAVMGAVVSGTDRVGTGVVRAVVVLVMGTDSSTTM